MKIIISRKYVFFSIFYSYYRIIKFFIIKEIEEFDIIIKKAKIIFIFINNVLP